MHWSCSSCFSVHKDSSLNLLCPWTYFIVASQWSTWWVFHIYANLYVEADWFHGGPICWGIVIHGFIDGYSHLITGLRASDNNWGDTVFDLFCYAAQAYGLPSQLHGDNGVENIVVATWMEENWGKQQGSYIWGRYVGFIVIITILISLHL